MSHGGKQGSFRQSHGHSKQINGLFDHRDGSSNGPNKDLMQMESHAKFEKTLRERGFAVEAYGDVGAEEMYPVVTPVITADGYWVEDIDANGVTNGVQNTKEAPPTDGYCQGGQGAGLPVVDALSVASMSSGVRCLEGLEEEEDSLSLTEDASERYDV